MGAASDVGAVGQPVSQYPKQAVVVIHGIGEQIPMDTIRHFVRAVWETDGSVQDAGAVDPGDVWSRPDLRTGSLELRRITTRQSEKSDAFPSGIRTDFYEMYWADLSAGSTWDEVKSWIVGLLFRNPFTRVPKNILFAWIVLWLASILVIFLAVLTGLPKQATLGGIMLWSLPPLAWFSDLQAWQLAVVTALLGFAMHRFIMPYAGRVVRYTRATPDNIAARRNIRERGLELLRQLHSAEFRYERVIIVGHSLGSILAYDLISYFWSQRESARTIAENTAEFAALRELERVVTHLDELGLQQYRRAQATLGATLRHRQNPDERWLITDFITLGSPLTHAEFLLARSKEDLISRKNDREFPTCPPFRELLPPPDAGKAGAAGFEVSANEPRLMCFPFGSKGGWQLHHAAPFAAVRWTNIFDPAFLIVCGDIVSGPLATVLGKGITDVNLRGLRGQSYHFTHTEYWSLGNTEGNEPPAQISELRKALDLSGKQAI